MNLEQLKADLRRDFEAPCVASGFPMPETTETIADGWFTIAGTTPDGSTLAMRVKVDATPAQCQCNGMEQEQSA